MARTGPPLKMTTSLTIQICLGAGEELHAHYIPKVIMFTLLKRRLLNLFFLNICSTMYWALHFLHVVWRFMSMPQSLWNISPVSVQPHSNKLTSLTISTPTNMAGHQHQKRTHNTTDGSWTLNISTRTSRQKRISYR